MTQLDSETQLCDGSLSRTGDADSQHSSANVTEIAQSKNSTDEGNLLQAGLNSLSIQQSTQTTATINSPNNRKQTTPRKGELTTTSVWSRVSPKIGLAFSGYDETMHFMAPPLPVAYIFLL